VLANGKCWHTGRVGGCVSSSWLGSVTSSACIIRAPAREARKCNKRTAEYKSLKLFIIALKTVFLYFNVITVVYQMSLTSLTHFSWIG
jgi:hypothetical protein